MAKTRLQVKKSEPEYSGPSFTTIITTAGIIGLIVALIAFFRYTLVMDIFGPTARTIIGVVIGLVLFGIGIYVYDRHPRWSLVSFGGAIFIEYLSFGMGVHKYGIINPYLGFIALLVFTIIGVLFSLKYNSLMLAHYSIIGGFLIPWVVNIQYDIFLLGFYFILVLGVLFISALRNWSSLRLVSYLFLIPYQLSQFNAFGIRTSTGLEPVLSLIAAIAFFLVYNMSSIKFSLDKKINISVADIFTLNLNSLVFASILYSLIRHIMTTQQIALILLIPSGLFLLEGYFLKTNKKANSLTTTINSILAAGIILLNIAIAMLVGYDNHNYFIIMYGVEWVLFTLLHENTENQFYNAFSKIFLVFVALWVLVNLNVSYMRLTSEATFVIVVFAVLIGVAYSLARNYIEPKLNAGLTSVGLFAFLYTLSSYLERFIAKDNIVSIILSLTWLVYSLSLYIYAERMQRRDDSYGSLKILGLIFVIITLIKIALFDLFILTDVYRILGFAIFGILLLLGGYILKK